jgi:hypothetical protein
VHLVRFTIDIYYYMHGPTNVKFTDISSFLFNYTATFLWILRFSVWCDWGLWCSGMWHCVIGWLVACVVKGSIAFIIRVWMDYGEYLWNIGNHPHNNTALHPRRLESWICMYFTHLRYFLITRCWSDWCCVPGIRNCSGRTGLCRWVCCQTKCLWVSHPQSPGYTGYVYVNVTHILCWNCEWKSVWLLQSNLTLLRLHCCSLIPSDFSPNFLTEL